MRQAENTSRGFTLLELMIAMALGLIVLSATVGLFKQAVSMNWVTSQRAELQSDFRGASNLLSRDIGMAGAGSLGQQGLAAGSLSLPVSGTPSVYPCSSSACSYVNGVPIAYPASGGANYIYSVIPGPSLGITVNGQVSDTLTVSYTDANMALNCYNVAYVSATQFTFTLPAVLPTTCILPSGVVTPQALNDPVVGLLTGDMIMFSTTSGPAAMGVVSSTPSSSTCGGQPCYTVNFTAGDPGFINQPTVATGSLLSLSGTTITSAVRLLVITYYLDISPVDSVTPRLMRIQSGKAPVPVAENVTYLKFTYNVDSGAAYYSNQATLPAGTNPTMITQVNIAHMTMRSQLHGQSGYQGLDLQTSITPRNLTFGQEYPISGSAY
jgi:prepilin-type N-terminal cleavage/methylation domain-containing protein